MYWTICRNSWGKDPMFKKTADTCSTEHNRLRLALQDLADNLLREHSHLGAASI